MQKREGYRGGGGSPRPIRDRNDRKEGFPRENREGAVSRENREFDPNAPRKEYPKSFYFTKVFIHGIISNFNVRDLKNGRKSVRLSISIDGGNKESKDAENYIPAEIDVHVEKRRLVARIKEFLNIGMPVLIEGRIVLVFIRNPDKIAKKIQYISADEITSSNTSKDVNFSADSIEVS